MPVKFGRFITIGTILVLLSVVCGCATRTEIRMRVVDQETGAALTNATAQIIIDERAKFSRKGVTWLPKQFTDANGEVAVPRHDIVLIMAPGHLSASLWFPTFDTCELLTPDPPFTEVFPPLRKINLKKEMLIVPLLKGEGRIDARFGPPD